MSPFTGKKVISKTSLVHRREILVFKLLLCHINPTEVLFGEKSYVYFLTALLETEDKGTVDGSEFLPWWSRFLPVHRACFWEISRIRLPWSVTCCVQFPSLWKCRGGVGRSTHHPAACLGQRPREHALSEHAADRLCLRDSWEGACCQMENCSERK